MGKKTVVCVVGTRPEAIKMAPVVIALRKQDYFDTKILATGQHAAMLDQALGHFRLTADLNLHIMKDRQSLDHNLITIVEKWSDIESWKNHLTTPHLRAYHQQVKDMVEGVTLKVLQPV